MGAWGAGSFENDAALDFVAEIVSLSDIERLFGESAADTVIDADLSCRIIVAAECVALMRGHASSDIPNDLAQRAASFGQPTMDLYDRSRDWVSAVMSRSELIDLWQEEGSGEWNRAMTDLMERLSRSQRKGKKRSTQKKPASNPSPCMFCDRPMGEGAFHMLDITVNDDEFSTMKMGGWVHLQCLNAALHPRHMIQTWDMDDELLDWVLQKHEAERAAREQDSD